MSIPSVPLKNLQVIIRTSHLTMRAFPLVALSKELREVGQLLDIIRRAGESCIDGFVVEYNHGQTPDNMRLSMAVICITDELALREETNYHLDIKVRGKSKLEEDAREHDILDRLMTALSVRDAKSLSRPSSSPFTPPLRFTSPAQPASMPVFSLTSLACASGAPSAASASPRFMGAGSASQPSAPLQRRSQDAGTSAAATALPSIWRSKSPPSSPQRLPAARQGGMDIPLSNLAQQRNALR